MKESKRRPRRRSGGPGPAGVARRWSQERRLEFIDFRLRWDGQLNRGDLTQFFGISVPQASLDIARYGELAPGNLAYDRASRTYLASPEFRSLYARATGPQSFLDELLAFAAGGEPERSRLGFRPPLAVAPTPGRSVSADVLVALQHAIRARSGLAVTYQSLTRPEPARRILSPHAFVHDGQRWHVRAYCHSRRSFRDFVIARILRVHGPTAGGLGSERDTAWHNMLELVLTPHPDLAPAQRQALEFDYGMVDGRASLECREALLFYVLERLHIGRDGREPARPPQIALANARELEKYWKRSGVRRVA